MSEPKLLPCPFCGSPAKTVGDASDWVIVCSNIKCVIAENWFRFDQWNTRAPDPLLERVIRMCEVLLTDIWCADALSWTGNEQIKKLLLVIKELKLQTPSLFPPKPESVSPPNRKQEKV